MTDIVPELLEKIKKEFDEKISKSKKIKSAMKAIEEGTCDYETAYNYASEVGEVLADTLKKNITKDVLPDGKMYYNIANRILNGGTSERDEYLKFLTSGESDYPIELLKIAGVDMSTEEPVLSALSTFEKLVNELDEMM